MKIDIIIVSNAFNDKLRALTCQTINTCKKSEPNIYFEFTILEKQIKVIYAKNNTIHYSFPFHYNKCLNLGIERTKNEWICLCNNDLIFMKGWATQLLRHKYLSMCPNWQENKNKKILKEGYKIRKHIVGWCIFVNRSVIKKIGGLHEGIEFWWSDHIYADQLKKAKIKHAIILNSYVKHLETQTLKLMPEDVMEKFQYKQENLYKKIKL